MSSQLLTSLRQGYDKLYIDSDAENRETYLERCLSETRDFKTQLRKLKAHLNKHIQETESLHNLGDTDQQQIDAQLEKLNKKHSLIQDKINKSYRQWDHTMKKNVKASLQRYNKFNKTAIAKLGKFKLDDIYHQQLPRGTKKHVERAISFHISRYHLGGMSHIPKQHMQRYLSVVYNIDPKISSKFLELGEITHDLKIDGNFESCLAWCQREKQKYPSPSLSELEYELYLLRALKMIGHNPVLEICQYLIQNIPKDCLVDRSTGYGRSASELLTKLIIVGNVENLQRMIAAKLDHCRRLFTREYSSRRKLPFNSPLFLITLSGLISFQYFVKYNQIKANAHVNWTSINELPFDVKLPDFLSRFHPVFICPVLKEETTEENPPYSLACHHVISKKALERLSKNGSLSFKCPYCPVQTTMSKTKRVNFVML